MQIKNVRVYGLEESIVRSSWPHQIGEPMDFKYEYPQQFTPDEKDNNRAFKLANTPTGSGHNNFLKGIIVQFDLKYPEYFSPQLQRYHWIDIVSSQSKMHKITSRELTRDDFTHDTFQSTVNAVNIEIKSYNSENDICSKEERFNRIISNLPSGYMKWMGISTNYLQLKTIYSQRRAHKLNEWQEFCDWVETLPMSELIINKKKVNYDR